MGAHAPGAARDSFLEGGLAPAARYRDRSPAAFGVLALLAGALPPRLATLA